MDKYKIVSRLGSGAFGSVYKAIHRESGAPCAIKRLHQHYSCSWEECLDSREIKALLELRHPSIIQLLAVIREKGRLFLVFELLGKSVYSTIQHRSTTLPEPKIRSWIRQALQGLEYLHDRGYVHRDIKPENLLLSSSGTMLKIADLGLARKVDETDEYPWTHYVSTRWYRAPEMLLRSNVYGPAVDVFALGAVAAELFCLQPLFPGTSEIDQIACIYKVLGSPMPATWPQGLALAAGLGVTFEPTPPQKLALLIPQASSSAIDLLSRMLVWDPSKRISAQEALQHPFICNGRGEKTVPLEFLTPHGAPLSSLQVASVASQLKQAAENIQNASPSTTRTTRSEWTPASTTTTATAAAATTTSTTNNRSKREALLRLTKKTRKRQRETLRMRKDEENEEGHATLQKV